MLGVIITALSVGVAVMIAYLIVAKVKGALPTSDLDATTQEGINNAQTTIYSGFTIGAVGVIVLAAWALMRVFM